MRSGAAAGHAGYFHETAFYESDDELLGVVVPFLRGGQEAGEPTLVTLNERNEAIVRAALGDGDGIEWVPASRQYRNPVVTIADYRRRLTALTAAGARQIRVVGDVPHTGTGGCWNSWCRYEAAVNHAYDDFPLWGLCPYDTRTTPDDVLEDVRRTHRHVALPDGRHVVNPAFVDPAAFLAARPAPAPHPLQASPPQLELSGPRPTEARAAVRALAHGHIPHTAVVDLTLAVSEIVANAHVHGRPPVTVRGWARESHVLVVVHDAGPGPGDPLAGLLPETRTTYEAGAGMGLWIAGQLCTEVTLDLSDGCSVRLAVDA
jgi:anti-sigma regulatory factor (Ser/Thr protein kinase)